MNYQEKMDEMISKIKKGSNPKLLLHACCAPCSSYCIEYLSEFFNITIYYYNPNIDTKEEYDKRVNELNKFVSEFKTKNPVNVVVETYDNSEYYKAVEGMENEEEGSTRCFTCYELRMRKAAQYAKKNRFKYFTTTLSISPYKNSNKLNEIGEKLGNEYNLKYLYADFKKKNGYKRSIELSKEYNLYRQDYCGCKYSKIARDKREQAKKIEEEKRLAKEEQDKKLNDFISTYRIDRPVKSIRRKKKPRFVRTILAFIIVVFALTIAIKNMNIDIPNVFNSIFEKTETSISEIKKKYTKDGYIFKDELSILNDYYIYGNHLNMNGSLETEIVPTSVKLLFVSKKNTLEMDTIYSVYNNTITYSLASNINTGLLLDKFVEDNYEGYINVVSNNKSYLFKIDNKSNYSNTTYYTVTNAKGKRYKVDFTSSDTLNVKVKETKDDVYDIILDAGHGGVDTGAKVNGRWETQYTLPYTLKLKSYLEEKGFRVALTRDSETKIPDYNAGGRVNKVHESNAKLVISIHFNNVYGANYSGFEFYCPYNSNLTFARSVRDTMKGLGLKTSVNRFNYVEDGIYIRTMNDDVLRDMQNDAIKNNYEAYKADTTTNYYFMIRETGEHMTGAYRDGRDGTGVNYYIDSNRGTESYIFEIGYIGNNDDMTFIENNNENILKQLANKIEDYLR